MENAKAVLTIPEVASLFGLSENDIHDLIEHRAPPVHQPYFSIGELAQRWRCSRGSVYNRLRIVGAKVLDFAAPGKRGKKAVPATVVLQIENRQTRRLN
jgi:predicted DNA-binding transcriptional regulator AlpA